MRLINADELIEAIDNQDNWLSQIDLSQFNIYSLINTMPTIHFVDVFNNDSYLNSLNHYCDSEPNKYVSRIDTECIMLECPECKSRIIANAFSYAVGSKGYSFCPYCGADMRKEPDNG